MLKLILMFMVLVTVNAMAEDAPLPPFGKQAEKTPTIDKLIAAALDNLFKNAHQVNKNASPVLIDSNGCLWGLKETANGLVTERIPDVSGKQACRNGLLQK